MTYMDFLAILACVLMIVSGHVDCPENERVIKNRVYFYWNIGQLWRAWIKWKHVKSRRIGGYSYTKAWFNKWGNGAYYRCFKKSVKF